MLGSAASGMLARIPCHPLDTAKARLQVQTSSGAYRGIVDVLARTWQNEGLRGLYRGFGAVLVGSGPAGMLYFTSYEVAKNELPRVVPFLSDSTAATHLLAGLAAESASCLLWVPIDVIKERMQIQRAQPHGAPGGAAASGVYYRNTADAVRQIMAREGVRGIYRGYGATIASFGPFSALYFVFYEKLKGAAQSWYGLTGAAAEQLPFIAQLATASGAGAAASWITSPLDLAKLRLQVQRGATAAATTGGANGGSLGFQYRNLPHALVSIARSEGGAALFRGALARVAFHAPSTAITMTLFERCKGAAAAWLGDD